MSEEATSPLAVIESYLRALEAKDHETVARMLDEEVRQVEYPNALFRTGATRDHAALLAGLEAGKHVLRGERYTLHEAIVEGDRAACRIHWTGTLAIELLGKQPGECIEAEFGVFFHLKQGRIVQQHNYDCFLL
jgi:predicted ester cyclase